MNVIIFRNVQATVIIAKSLSDPYVMQCTGLNGGDYLSAIYPNNFYFSFVSLLSDSTPYFYVNVIYTNYQTQSTVNSVKCFNVSNTVP